MKNNKLIWFFLSIISSTHCSYTQRHLPVAVKAQIKQKQSDAQLKRRQSKVEKERIDTSSKLGQMLDASYKRLKAKEYYQAAPITNQIIAALNSFSVASKSLDEAIEKDKENYITLKMIQRTQYAITVDFELSQTPDYIAKFDKEFDELNNQNPIAMKNYFELFSSLETETAAQKIKDATETFNTTMPFSVKNAVQRAFHQNNIHTMQHLLDTFEPHVLTDKKNYKHTRNCSSMFFDFLRLPFVCCHKK